jgi:hypothetical protein
VRRPPIPINPPPVLFPTRPQGLVQLWLPDTCARRFAAQVAQISQPSRRPRRTSRLGEALERGGLADLRECD